MSQTYYTRNYEQSLPGKLVGNGAPPRTLSLSNSAQASPQTGLLEVTGAGAGAGDYTIVIPIVGQQLAETTVTFNLPNAHTIPQLVNAAILAINTTDKIYQNALYAAANPLNPAQIQLIGIQEGVNWSANPIVITAAGAGPGSFGAPVITPAAVAENIGFGLFVGREPTESRPVATLPPIGSTTWVPDGVTLSTRFAEKDRIGPDAISVYYPNEIMDVVNNTDPLKGIEVITVDPEIARNVPLYVSTQAGTRGRLTSLAAGGILLPNATIESPVRFNALVGFNLATVRLR